ncbi:DNA repair radA-like protein [Hordeum vulgare]|nr:DNA repair radA-like protein [Hordeum vulgare]
MAFATMPAMSVLDLSNNLLCGEIPISLGSSPALEMLSVVHNNLTGPVPATGLLRTINPDDLAGNPGLCSGGLPLCTASAPRASSSIHQRSHAKHNIAAGWVIGISLTLVACGAAFLGSLVLVGGDPGVGKSTLMLQLASIVSEDFEDHGSSNVVYVSSEEGSGKSAVLNSLNRSIAYRHRVPSHPKTEASKVQTMMLASSRPMLSQPSPEASKL